MIKQQHEFDCNLYAIYFKKLKRDGLFYFGQLNVRDDKEKQRFVVDDLSFVINLTCRLFI